MRSSSVPTDVPKPSASPSGGTLPDAYKVRYSVSPQPEKPPLMPNPSIFAPPMPADLNKPIGQPGVYNNPFRPPQPGNYMQYPPYQNPLQQGQQPLNVNYNNPLNFGQPQTFNSPPPQAGMQPPTGYSFQGNQLGNQSYNANRNFKTVPCKYFHSPQGCVKANNCTFIHDEEYAGKPTPSMLKSNRGMIMTNYGDNPMGANFYPPFPNGPYDAQN